MHGSGREARERHSWFHSMCWGWFVYAGSRNWAKTGVFKLSSVSSELGFVGLCQNARGKAM